MWELVPDDGDYYLLYNRTGVEALDVEIRAGGIQLDGNGKDFVRRVTSIPSGGPVRISLRRVWGGTGAELHISWQGTDERRDEWGVRL
jgi:hypothetical protein